METQRIFILKGEMGNGKTALIKSLAKVLDIKDEISSPTYSIVNEYLLPNGKKLFHFDLYRINDIEELYDIGIEEYFHSNDFCFIEWPEIAMDLIPKNSIEIKIELRSDVREIEVTDLKI